MGCGRSCRLARTLWCMRVSDQPVELDIEAPPPPPPPPGGYEAVRAAESIDPLRYVPANELGAQRVSDDVVAKLNAGMRLFFAIYYSPHARDILNAASGPEGKTRGLLDAYMAAQRAFLPR